MAFGATLPVTFANPDGTPFSQWKNQSSFVFFWLQRISQVMAERMEYGTYEMRS